MKASFDIATISAMHDCGIDKSRMDDSSTCSVGNQSFHCSVSEMKGALIGSRVVRRCKSLRSLKSSLLMILLFLLCFLIASVAYAYMVNFSERPYLSGSSVRLLPVNTTWTPRQDHCDVTEVQSWKKNVVTLVQSRIEAD